MLHLWRMVRNIEPELLTKDLKLYLTAYAHFVHLVAQRPWDIFFQYASLSKSFPIGYAILVQGHLQQMQKVKDSYAIRKSHGEVLDINLQYRASPVELQFRYPEVSLSWYGTLFLCSFATLMAIFGSVTCLFNSGLSLQQLGLMFSW